MHPAPLVDAATLGLLRRRLTWGLLGLEQPPADLTLSLHHFGHRWAHSQPPPLPGEWQRQVLSVWRQQPRSRPAPPIEPVLDVLLGSLTLENGQCLDGWFSPMLFEVVRSTQAPEQIRPVLRYSWQQLSQGVQQLRQGLGPFSGEAEGALRTVLAAMQQVQYYFQSPQALHLEEASRRWGAAMEDWERVANLCLCGLQPATSSLQWGRLLDQLEPGDACSELRNRLARWFQEWSVDLVYTVSPYLGQALGVAPALESLGLALLRWQKLLPGWPEEIADRWNLFVSALPPIPESIEEPPPIFRWLEPEYAIEEDFVRLNPWREWLRLARRHPPGQAATGVLATRLDEGLRMGRLWSALVQPAFLRLGLEFPEYDWVHEASEFLGAWKEGYDPLSEPAAAHIESRVSQLERFTLRDFLYPGRTHGPQTA